VPVKDETGVAVACPQKLYGFLVDIQYNNTTAYGELSMNGVQSFIIVGGVSGAGKTTAISQIDTTSYVMADSNLVKVQFGYADQANAIHEASSQVAKEVLHKAVEEKYHVIYESQLTNFSLIETSILRVLLNGGRIHIAYLDIDHITGVVRTRIRKKLGESQLEVPDEVIIKGYNYSLPTFLELYKRYKENPSISFSLRDNKVDFRNPVLVFTQRLPMLDEGGHESSLHTRTVTALEHALDNINPNKDTPQEVK
jgi:predicted ABC-type ATPase